MSEADEENRGDNPSRGLFSLGATGNSRESQHKGLSDSVPGESEEEAQRRRDALGALQNMRAAGRENPNQYEMPRDACFGDGCRPHPIPEARHQQEDFEIYNQMGAGQNKRPKIMPDQYDGKTSWIDYLAHFEICCEINGWNFAQRTQYLSVSLRGAACQVMCSLPVHKRRDYRELIQALGRRFHPENQSELYRVQLRNRARKANETLPELGQQIRQLVAQAYPGANVEVMDALGKDYFIDSLEDPDLRWRIYQAKPDTLDDTICIAVEFEAYRAAEKQRTSGRRYVRGVEWQQGAQAGRNLDKDTPTIKSLQQQLAELTRKIEQVQEGRRRPRDFKSNEDSLNRCWRCGETGHFQRNCPKDGQNKNLN